MRRFRSHSVLLLIVASSVWTGGCVHIEPRRYDCVRASGPIIIDGLLDEPDWRRAEWTEAFVDIEGGAQPPPRFETRAKMCWDDQFFYISARMEEPHVWATLTERDSIVFHDNDFEVFIDPDSDSRDYYEIEVNALNTIFDLLLVRTYRDHGPALHGWNLAGLRSAVHVDGTLNDPRNVDRGWTVEMALPWSSLAEYAHRPSPPQPGDVWRVNFSRVEWRHAIVSGTRPGDQGAYRKIPKLREDNWVWSPQGAIDMHIPDRWGFVTFAETPASQPKPD